MKPRHGLHRPGQCCVACYRWHESLTFGEAFRMGPGSPRVAMEPPTHHTSRDDESAAEDFERFRNRKIKGEIAAREAS